MKTSTRIWISILLLFVFGFGYYAYFLNAQAKISEENQYNYSFLELVNHINNMENYLAKSMISNDSKHATDTLIKVWADSNLAVSYIKNIPFDSHGSDKAIKFLNQVSDYSYTLSRKTLRGEALSEENFQNLKKLYDYASNLKNIVNQLSLDLNNGVISWDSLKKDRKLDMVEENMNIFTSIDGSFDDYEGLIYDGAYSDYVNKQDKLGLIGKEISKEEAETKLKNTFHDATEIKCLGKIKGDIISYDFQLKEEDSIYEIQISQKGGWIVEIIKDRAVGEVKIEKEEAIQKGKEYLNKLGYSNMKETYFLQEENIVTINYAYEENGILFYPDLIKVKIALDNGEILGMEALGYLNAHTIREFSQEIISLEEAKSKLSNHIVVENERMAVIPLDDKTEKYCYEFKGKVENKQFLVYINAETGEEEEILILLETPGGTLTI